MPSILIVEDEQYIIELITITFTREGFEVFTSDSVETAYANLEKTNFDVVLLDINLNGKNGYEVCHYIKQKSPITGVIMVTAKSQDVDKVYGLEAGADDYVVKPFNPYELVARVRALLRRTSTIKEQNRTLTNPMDNILCFGNLTINITGKAILQNGNEIKVTPKEFELLLMLSSKPGTVFSRDELLNQIWGSENFVDFKTVDVHVARLRDKIESNTKKPEFIETVWGVGYKWKG